MGVTFLDCITEGEDHSMTTEPTTTPKPKRRWFQFSLRTLLVLMLVFGCGFGRLGMKVKQTRGN